MKLAQYLRAKAAAALGKRASLPPTIDIAKPMQEAAEQVAKEAGVSSDALHWMDLAAPLVEKFEGLARIIPGNKVAAYPDPATGGKPWTIGIGSTTDEDGYLIAPGTVWTIERARKRFRAHLAEFGEQVDHLLGDAPTTPQQKAALTSLAYNIGSSALARSTLLRRHKERNYAAAGYEFTRWNRAAGKVLKGLVRRRAAERELYES